jgi:hypothetical protein
MFNFTAFKSWIMHVSKPIHEERNFKNLVNPPGADDLALMNQFIILKNSSYFKKEMGF